MLKIFKKQMTIQNRYVKMNLKFVEGKIENEVRKKCISKES